MRVFRAHEHEQPSRILAAVHAGLGHTRGGAVSVARYDPECGTLVFTGIGNVAGAVITGGVTKRLVPYPEPPGSSHAVSRSSSILSRRRASW